MANGQWLATGALESVETRLCPAAKLPVIERQGLTENELDCQRCLHPAVRRCEPAVSMGPCGDY